MLNSKKKMFILLSCLSLLISLGYAVLSSHIVINGNSKLANSTWDIHFDNVQVREGSVLIGENDQIPTITPNNNCEVTYNVTLNKPGDFYEFTVDVINAGTVDGMIDVINSTISIGNDIYTNDNISELPNFLDYSVTYSDGVKISPNHLLESGETETYLVKIMFKKDIENSDLPSEETTINYNLSVDYKQKNENAKPRPEVYNCTYDGELVQGAEYVNGQYTYRYMQEYIGDGWQNIDDDGWGVTLTNKESTDPVTTNFCTTINNKNVVSMQGMFANSQTSSIDTRSINTSNVKTMNGMFYGLANIQNLDLSNFDTSSVEDMSSMFGNSSNIDNLDLSSFDTSKVQYMTYMFAGCTSLKKLDLSSFDLSGLDLFKNNPTYLMLDDTDNLEEIKIPASFIPNEDVEIDLNSIFYGDDDSEFEYLNIDNNSDSVITIKKKKRITINNAGMVETTTPTGMYIINTPITLRAKEQDGLVFTRWSNGETTKEISFTLSDNVEIEPYYTYNNIAIFDTGTVVNDKIINVSNIPQPNSNSNTNIKYLKHFERSNNLPSSISSIDLSGITVTSEEIDDWIDNNQSSPEMFSTEEELREYAERKVIHYKKTDLLGDYLISSSESGYDIYGWFSEDNETYYYYTESDDIFLNFDSSLFFNNIYSLEDINGLNQVNTYLANNINKMFYNCQNITHLDLGNFDLSGLTYNLNNNSTKDVLTGMNSLRKITTPKVMFSANLPEISLIKMYQDINDNIYITLNSNTPSRIELNAKEISILDTGMNVNKKLRITARDDNGEFEVEPHLSSPMIVGSPLGYEESDIYCLQVYPDKNIKKIIKANSLPNGFVANTNNTISASYSYYPIYIWYDYNEKIIYYYTEADKIYLNQDSTYMFGDMANLESIDGLNDFDSSVAETIALMFYHDYNLKTLDMTNWDLSNLKKSNRKYYFYTATGIDSISPTYYMLEGASLLKNIISPKSMYEFNDVEIILPLEFKDSNNNTHTSINYNTPVNIQFTTTKKIVTLNTNGGNKVPDLEVMEGSAVGDLPIPTKDLNHFVGWYTSLENGVKVESDYVINNDTEIYARWQACEYHEITFDKNDSNATGTMEIQNIPDLESPLNTNNYVLEGYKFIGWNTESNGTGTSYLDGEKVLITEDTTLYAQWHKIYTITFDKNNNDAVGDSFTMEVLSGLATEIPRYYFYKYELSNKEIDSWNTSSDYSGIAYYKSQQITLTNNITLYAHWQNSQITSTIYWALQDNDNDNKKETLVISSYEVDGVMTGSFNGNTVFSGTNSPPWNTYSGSFENNPSYYVSNIKIEGLVKPKSTSRWFREVGNRNRQEFNVDLDNLDTSEVTDMSQMFYSAANGSYAINLDLSDLNTSKVTDMGSMFSEFGEWSAGVNLKLSNWNTSKVTNMSAMFYECGAFAKNFRIIGLQDWDTSQVTSMSWLFHNAGNYAPTWNIGDLSDWDTSNVTKMYDIFHKSSNSLPRDIRFVSNWNVSKVTDMSYMFYGIAYTMIDNDVPSFYLDLSSWDTKNVEDMSYMFRDTGYYNTGDIVKWQVDGLENFNTSKVTNMSYMFYSAGSNADTFSLNTIKNWDVSSLNRIYDFVSRAGYNSIDFSVDISNWNMSNISSLNGFFNKAGYKALNWNAKIPKTNGNGLNNTQDTIYGNSSTVSESAPTDKDSIPRKFSLASN